MITLTREEAQQVLDDLEGEIPFYSENDCNTPEWITNAIELLRVKLSAPEPKPWNYDVQLKGDGTFSIALPDGDDLVIVPPQRGWQGLTDEEIMSLLPGAVRLPLGWADTARAIEAKLKEKNT